MIGSNEWSKESWTPDYLLRKHREAVIWAFRARMWLIIRLNQAAFGALVAVGGCERDGGAEDE